MILKLKQPIFYKNNFVYPLFDTRTQNRIEKTVAWIDENCASIDTAIQIITKERNFDAFEPNEYAKMIVNFFNDCLLLNYELVKRYRLFSQKQIDFVCEFEAKFRGVNRESLFENVSDTNDFFLISSRFFFLYVPFAKNKCALAYTRFLEQFFLRCLAIMMRC